MRLLLVLILAGCLSASAAAQERDTTWGDLSAIETEFYYLVVPANWLNLGAVGNNVDQTFDGTGMFFTDSFNKAPVLVGLFVMTEQASNLADAKDKCLKGYRSNLGRDFPVGFKEGQEKITLVSGQPAWIVNTRFYRPAKQLNQSRYDLVVYSAKAKQAYFVTVTVQYKDESYAFEKDNRLMEFAKRIFSYFQVK